MTTSLPATAMVFAAGLGRRMRPVTDHLPKPLVSVAGKPMLDHMLDRLAAEQVSRAIVNVHYHADRIEAHLQARSRPRVILSDERDLLLDQGGGIKRVLDVIGPHPFLICNTDALWVEGPRSNLRRLGQMWDPDRMDVLLLVAAAATSTGVDWPGDFTMDALGRLSRRDERGVAPFVYAGVGIIKPELFYAETAEVFRLAPFFFRAAAAGRLFGCRLEGIWLHVGTPQAIAAAEAAIELSVQ